MYRKVRYIGNFPPPYGGVTRKNELLYETISKYTALYRFHSNFLGKKISEIINIILMFMPNQLLIIGVSETTGKSKIITKLLYYFSRKNMQSSLYFMMGGTAPDRIISNPKELNQYSQYGQIYVETEIMKGKLEKAGLSNVSVYPNCRKAGGLSIATKDLNEKDERLNCVFFSCVNRKKGVDIILEAAKRCEDVEFDIYGPLEEAYESDFKTEVLNLDNVQYRGVFVGTDDEIIRKLKEYDLLLLPTRYKTEGVPGILIEGKFAGVPAIVSDICYNKEIVLDSEEGIVLSENTSDMLAEVISSIDKNTLEVMKKNAFKSRKRYDIDSYIVDIICQIKKGGGFVHYIN